MTKEEFFTSSCIICVNELKVRAKEFPRYDGHKPLKRKIAAEATNEENSLTLIRIFDHYLVVSAAQRLVSTNIYVQHKARLVDYLENVA